MISFKLRRLPKSILSVVEVVVVVGVVMKKSIYEEPSTRNVSVSKKQSSDGGTEPSTSNRT